MTSNLAVADYSQTLRFAPDLVDVHIAGARLFATLGRDDTAQVDVDTVAKLGVNEGTLQAKVDEIRRRRKDG